MAHGCNVHAEAFVRGGGHSEAMSKTHGQRTSLKMPALPQESPMEPVSRLRVTLNTRSSLNMPGTLGSGPLQQT